MPPAGKTYGAMANNIKGLSKGLHYGAIGLGGLAAGIGGYTLYQKLKEHLDRKKQLALQQQQQQSY
jgi:hypothetical protein